MLPVPLEHVFQLVELAPSKPWLRLMFIATSFGLPSSKTGPLVDDPPIECAILSHSQGCFLVYLTPILVLNLQFLWVLNLVWSPLKFLEWFFHNFPKQKTTNKCSENPQFCTQWSFQKLFPAYFLAEGLDWCEPHACALQAVPSGQLGELHRTRHLSFVWTLEQWYIVGIEWDIARTPKPPVYLQ